MRHADIHEFERSIVGEIAVALECNLPLLQVLVGPRQVGKTTAASQVEKRLGWPRVVASADAASTPRSFACPSPTFAGALVGRMAPIPTRRFGEWLGGQVFPGIASAKIFARFCALLRQQAQGLILDGR